MNSSKIYEIQTFGMGELVNAAYAERCYFVWLLTYLSAGEASLKRTITDAVSAENIAAMDLSPAHWYATFFWPLHCVSAGSLEENPASSGGILQRRVPCRSPCEDGREVFAR